MYRLRAAEVADGVWQFSDPLQSLNVYLADGVLIDAATRWHRPAILRALTGRPVRLVALTHCHPDHQGAAKAVCDRFGVALACHEADADAMEGRKPMPPLNGLGAAGGWTLAGPPHPVSRRLRDGDWVGDFRVIHAPGHTPGHVIFFRDRDRLAVIGDVLGHMEMLTGRVRLVEPPAFFASNVAENRRSIRLLADLRPEAVLFGHGPPLRNSDALTQFAERLS
jgi:glyoxylase-like metal-dependent hydrolase (beta-lactamase superfamily II)